MSTLDDVEKHVSGKRIADRIARLAEIGGVAGGGVTRLPFTAEDGEGRMLFVRWLRNLELSVTTDGAGNIIGRIDGEDKSAPAVVIGSHLDSQPQGGRFDGVAGVVAALEVADAIREAGFRHRHPIEVINFSGEESGARFDVAMVGSRAMVGGFPPEDLQTRCRIWGMTLGEAMESIDIDVGRLADAPRAVGSIKAMLELHVEQGPYLERWKKRIGIVTEVAGSVRLTCIVHGQQAHSGAMPMPDRRDPMPGAAAVVLAVEMAARSRQDPPVVATVAYMDSSPRAMAVIPRCVRMIIDIRSISQKSIDETRREVVDAARNLAAERGLRVEWGSTWSNAPAQMNAEIAAAFEAECRALGVDFARMPSGGGHDAMKMGQRFQSGMIFVPSVGGISHAPEELTHIEDLELGTRILCRAACKMST